MTAAAAERTQICETTGKFESPYQINGHNDLTAMPELRKYYAQIRFFSVLLAERENRFINEFGRTDSENICR